MADPVRLFITAGEPSGDHIGADLVSRLRHKRDIALTGVGGVGLAGQGLASLFPMSDLSVMGMSDVIARFPLLWWRMRQTVRAIVKGQPDIAVLIDSQVFSATVARKARAGGYRGPILLYVAPAVWAWRPERAKALNGLFDEVLAVLPFEPKVMQELGGPATTYVGHPALAEIKFRNAVPDRGSLLLLPGSRGGELRRHLPVMARVAAALADHPRLTGMVLPTPPSQLAEVSEAVGGWKVPVRIVASTAEKAEAFESAAAAAAVSGTVTLELALSGVPMAVTYVTDPGQHRNWLKAGSPLAALPNILAGGRVVPELVALDPQPDWLIGEVRKLLDQQQAAAPQLEAFAAIRRSMETAASDPADRVLAHL
jgi:lipid-A-disaccharide synthase